MMRHRFIVLVGLCLPVAGCRSEMYDQPRYEALEPSGFFRDGKSARPLVEGTIAQGQLSMDEHFYAGKQNGELVNTFPFPITPEILQRGQERFNIYCSPCHSRLGDGRGMIVQRGFQSPPSFHIPRLREAPVGHFFDVITKGFGAMFDYSAQISPRDRWAIIAYIRALQLSQHANINDVSAEERDRLLRAK